MTPFGRFLADIVTVALVLAVALLLAVALSGPVEATSLDHDQPAPS